MTVVLRVAGHVTPETDLDAWDWRRLVSELHRRRQVGGGGVLVPLGLVARGLVRQPEE